MIRFTMPEKNLCKSEKIRQLNSQFDKFLSSPALQGLVEILKDSTLADSNDIRQFFASFDARKDPQSEKGSPIERQCIRTPKELREIFESNREELYSHFYDLGFFSINKPIKEEFKPKHILILGASFNACFNRTLGTKRILKDNLIDSSNLEYISSLGAYRIINPAEKKNSAFESHCETEFGALSDALISVFELDSYEDEFKGPLNINKNCCIRTFTRKDNVLYRVYAAASSEPNRRADSSDTYKQYIAHNNLKNDSCLLITNNIYTNYQFIPFCIEVLKHDLDIEFDIIGCSKDEDITKKDEFDPYAYTQNVISIITWIYIFKETFNLV